ncbi:MAG: cyclic nucleotide-binding domain-containing protein [Actinomycetes bacterium]
MILHNHPFLAGLPEALVDRLAEHAHPVTLAPDHRIFAEGAAADRFWLIENGTVALDIQVPGRGTVVLETLGPWTVLGWSWLQPPYRWHFGAVARQTTVATEFHAPEIRALLAADPLLGYALTSRFLPVIVDRLQAARLRLLDLYAAPAKAGS